MLELRDMRVDRAADRAYRMPWLSWKRFRRRAQMLSLGKRDVVTLAMCARENRGI